MGWAAAAIVGGALISANASQNAANTQASAANNASNIQEQEFNTANANSQPWIQSGQAGLSQLNSQMPQLTAAYNPSNFTADPGYQFSLQQGEQAIKQNAAAKGLLGSTGTSEALNNYAQGDASQYYQQAFNNYNTSQTNTFNKLATMANIGQVANNNVNNAGVQTANSVAQNTIGAGNAQAAGMVGSANAINGAVGTGMNTWMQQQYLNNMPQNSGSNLSTPGYSMPVFGSSAAPAASSAGGSYLGANTNLSSLGG